MLLNCWLLNCLIVDQKVTNSKFFSIFAALIPINLWPQGQVSEFCFCIKRIAKLRFFAKF